MAWRRCPSCTKGCGVEQGDPELNLDLEAEDDGKYRVTGDVRLVLTSACCGEEIAESNQAVPDEGTEFVHPKKPGGKKHNVEIGEESAESCVDVTGKGRGLRTFYGAEATVTLKCSCGWSDEVHFKVSEQASAFDELN